MLPKSPLRQPSAQALVLNLDPLGPALAGVTGTDSPSHTDSCPAAVLHDMLALPQQPLQPQPAAGPVHQTLDSGPEKQGAAAAVAAAARTVRASLGEPFASGWNVALRAALAQPALRARVNALHDRGAFAGTICVGFIICLCSKFSPQQGPLCMPRVLCLSKLCSITLCAAAFCGVCLSCAQLLALRIAAQAACPA